MQRADLGWGLIRLFAGVALAAFHGYGKLFGGGVYRLANRVAGMGLPFPTVSAWAATLTEFVGGILLAIGLATRPVGALIASTMLVAMYSHRNDPISKLELPGFYLVVAIAAILMGSGRYGLDPKLRLRFPIAPKGG